MARRRIRAHYKQLSEFERVRIIRLKETGWANRRIAPHMGRSDAAVRRCWQEWVGRGRFQRHDGRGRLKATTDREDRLIWFLARSGYNHADWRRIVFSDESHFQLCPDHHRRRLWRHPGKHSNPAFTIARHTGPQPGVIVWGAISFDNRTPLGVLRVTLTAQRFVDDILRTALLPFLLQYPGLIFQQENS
ncbi:HTH_Tnp_Tc3_2 domain-containing protein [Trichonephila clavipes]|nr:HTH_Tnp_Tc3_2 domain-containing protein [Trichonephila clavipes]